MVCTTLTQDQISVLDHLKFREMYPIMRQHFGNEFNPPNIGNYHYEEPYKPHPMLLIFYLIIFLAVLGTILVALFKEEESHQSNQIVKDVVLPSQTSVCESDPRKMIPAVAKYRAMVKRNTRARKVAQRRLKNFRKKYLELTLMNQEILRQAEDSPTLEHQEAHNQAKDSEAILVDEHESEEFPASSDKLIVDHWRDPKPYPAVSSDLLDQLIRKDHAEAHSRSDELEGRSSHGVSESVNGRSSGFDNRYPKEANEKRRPEELSEYKYRDAATMTDAILEPVEVSEYRHHDAATITDTIPEPVEVSEYRQHDAATMTDTILEPEATSDLNGSDAGIGPFNLEQSDQPFVNTKLDATDETASTSGSDDDDEGASSSGSQDTPRARSPDVIEISGSDAMETSNVPKASPTLSIEAFPELISEDKLGATAVDAKGKSPIPHSLDAPVSETIPSSADNGTELDTESDSVYGTENGSDQDTVIEEPLEAAIADETIPPSQPKRSTNLSIQIPGPSSPVATENVPLTDPIIGRSNANGSSQDQSPASDEPPPRPKTAREPWSRAAQWRKDRLQAIDQNKSKRSVVTQPEPVLRSILPSNKRPMSRQEARRRRTNDAMETPSPLLQNFGSFALASMNKALSPAVSRPSTPQETLSRRASQAWRGMFADSERAARRRDSRMSIPNTPNDQSSFPASPNIPENVVLAPIEVAPKVPKTAPVGGGFPLPESRRASADMPIPRESKINGFLRRMSTVSSNRGLGYMTPQWEWDDPSGSKQ